MIIIFKKTDGSINTAASDTLSYYAFKISFQIIIYIWRKNPCITVKYKEYIFDKPVSYTCICNCNKLEKNTYNVETTSC